MYVTPKRHEPGFVELGSTYGHEMAAHVHIRDVQAYRFPDPHSCSIEKKQQCTKCVCRHCTCPVPLTLRKRINQCPKIGQRIDIRNECSSDLRATGRKWNRFEISSQMPVFEEHSQNSVLDFPSCPLCMRAIEKLKHLRGRDPMKE